MNEKPMKVIDMARMRGIVRAKVYKKVEIRAWGKQ